MSKKLSFFASFTSAQHIVLLAAGAAQIATAQTDSQAAFRAAPVGIGVQTQSIQATKAVTASAQTTPEAVAMRQHIDRMENMVQERNYLLTMLRKWEINGDKAVIARLQSELQSIDREIALISRQSVYPTSNTPSNQKDSEKPVSTAQTITTESQPLTGNKVTHEGWDIFRNFGHKGNQQ